MTEKEICALYSDPSRSLESVAKQAKTSVYLVRRCLDKNGIEIRPSGRPRVGITDPKALVHLGVKITKSDRDALETGAGKSANVREAIRLWKDRDKEAGAKMTEERLVTKSMKSDILLHCKSLEARICAIYNEYEIAQDISNQLTDIERLPRIQALIVDLKVTQVQLAAMQKMAEKCDRSQDTAL